MNSLARRRACALLNGAALGSAIAIWPAATYAQVGSTATDQVNRGVQDIVVTARRRSEDLQNQPLAISALSTATLERQNVQRLDDIGSIPNVNFNNSPGYVNSMVPVIRGIGEQDPILTNDSPIALYVDGVLYARQVGTLLDVVDPERIEVLRGPQGSLFGRNTTGGAVSITSKAPTEAFGLAFHGGYGTNNDYTVRGSVNSGRIGGSSLRARLTYQHQQNDGYVRNLDDKDRRYWAGSNNSDAFFFSMHAGDGPLTADLRADRTEQVGYTYTGQLSYMSPLAMAYFSQSPNYGGDPLLVSPNYLSAIYDGNYPRARSRTQGSSLTLNYAASPAFNLKSISAIRSLRYINSASVTGSGNLMGLAVNSATGVTGVQPVSPFDYPESGRSHQHQTSQELQLSGKIGNNQYVAGLYYFHERSREMNIYNFTFPPPIFTPEPLGFIAYSGRAYTAATTSYAAYISDTWKPPILGERLELSGGLRYTIDRKSIAFLALPPYVLTTVGHKRHFSRVSGDFTASFHWTPDVMTYARFANGYKSGGFSGRNDAASLGFMPETANNYEIGIKSTLFDRLLRLNADVFYTKYNDKQVSTYLASVVGQEPVNRVQNAGSARYRGVELEVTLAPAQGFELNGSFGYTDPKFLSFLYQPTADSPVTNIADSAKFPFFAKTNYSLGGHYTLPRFDFGELTFSVNYNYKSSLNFAASPVFSPLMDVMKSGPMHDLSMNLTLADIPLGGENASLSVYGKNVLNQHRRVLGSDFELAPGYNYTVNAYNRPRVVGVMFDVKY